MNKCLMYEWDQMLVQICEQKSIRVIKYKGVSKKKQEDHIVANQFNILIPVGIAIIDVEKVK